MWDHPWQTWPLTYTATVDIKRFKLAGDRISPAFFLIETEQSFFSHLITLMNSSLGMKLKYTTEHKTHSCWISVKDSCLYASVFDTVNMLANMLTNKLVYLHIQHTCSNVHIHFSWCFWPKEKHVTYIGSLFALISMSGSRAVKFPTTTADS